MVDLTLVFTRLVTLKLRSAVAVAEARNYSKLLPFYVFIYIKLFVSNIQVSTYFIFLLQNNVEHVLPCFNGSYATDLFSLLRLNVSLHQHFS